MRLVLDAPAGAAPVAILEDAAAERAWRVALSRRGERWEAEVRLPARPTIVRYRFALADGTTVRERRQVEGTHVPLFGVWEERDFRIAAYDASAPPPAWARGAVVYQIFPDRFARGGRAHAPGGTTVYSRPALELPWGAAPERPSRGRDFFGGDLAGIEAKLEVLADLGVDCVYLTPIFASPTNHRYDALDYDVVDPRLGTNDDLRSLLRAAAGRGMRVVLDGVFNHCSSESPYLRAARERRDAPTFRWFEFFRWPDRYRTWLDVKYMPQFAESPEVLEFFFGPDGVARRRLREGAAGWRLDVAGWKSDAFWRRLREAALAERPDAYLIAEEWSDATGYLLGDTFDAAMNYRFANTVNGFANGRLTPAELDDRLETLRRDTPEPRFHTQLNLLDSHDTPRLLTLCGGDRSRVRLAVALQMGYPGAPMVYYGDEAGLEGEYAEDGRRCYPWDAPEDELRGFFRRAIHARRGSAALRSGDVRTLLIDDATGAYAFARERDGDRVVVALNGGAAAAELAIPLPDARPRWRDLLDDASASARGGVLRVRLAPHGAAYLAETP